MRTGYDDYPILRADTRLDFGLPATNGSPYPLAGSGSTALRIRGHDTYIDDPLTEVMEKAAELSKAINRDIHIQLSGGSFGGLPAEFGPQLGSCRPDAMDADWEEIPPQSYRLPVTTQARRASVGSSSIPRAGGGGYPSDIPVGEVVLGFLEGLGIFGVAYVWWASISGDDPVGNAVMSLWKSICGLF